MELDLSKVISNTASNNQGPPPAQYEQADHGRGQPQQDEDNDMNYEEGAMRSERSVHGIVSGYLVKTAQNMSKMQRKQFFRRYYILDMNRRLLKIYAKENGALKDTVKCQAITHVVANLVPKLRQDYGQFFKQAPYKDIKVVEPKEYPLPFAVFLEGTASIMLLWAANIEDFKTWTLAFQEMAQPPPSMGHLALPNQNASQNEIPQPALSDANYFVATVYTCLLPEKLTHTNLEQLETARDGQNAEDGEEESKAAEEVRREPAKSDGQVQVSDHQVMGWMLKTVRDVGRFTKNKFAYLWFILDARTQTLTSMDSPQNPNKNKTVTQFRLNPLVNVDTQLLNVLPERAKNIIQKNAQKNLQLPQVHTQPLGLAFANGDSMLLWVSPGKDFKVWSRALMRFKEQQVGPCSTTTFLTTQEKEFDIALYRSLVPVPAIQDKNGNAEDSKEECKSFEGWLCRTTQSLPKGDKTKPFERAYCTLDMQNLCLCLSDKAQGKELERIQLKDRLCKVDTNLKDVINRQIDHPLAQKDLIQNVKLPFAFNIPFALCFSDGDLCLLWASTHDELAKWTSFCSRLIPEETVEDSQQHYVIQTKNNAFLTTLYMSLKRGGDQSAGATQKSAVSNQLTSKRGSSQAVNELEETKGESAAAEVVESQQEQPDQITRGQLTECVLRADADGDQIEIAFQANYYELDQESQSLKVVNGDTEEVIEEIYLATRLCTVVTALNCELPDDAFDVSGGWFDPSEVELPSQDVAPIALHFTDGSLMIFWANTVEERARWETAFQAVEKSGGTSDQTDERVWITLSEENQHLVNLYKCLTPQPSQNLQIEEEDLEQVQSSARVAVSKLEPFQDSPFMLSYLRLDAESMELNVYSDTEYTELQQSVQLMGKLRGVDSTMQNGLVPSHRQIMEESDIGISSLELPADDYEYPIGLLFYDGSVMLIWLQSIQEYATWVQALELFVEDQEEKSIKFIVHGPENTFSSVVYRCLNRLSAEQAAELRGQKPQAEFDELLSPKSPFSPNMKMFDFDLEGPDIIHGWLSRAVEKRTSNRDPAFLFRFYRLETKTGILSEYVDQKQGKKVNEYQLWRKISSVEINLTNQLREDNQAIFKAYGTKFCQESSFEMPNDSMKPIALHLVDGQIILLWTPTNSTDFEKWVKAFVSLQMQSGFGTLGQRRLIEIKSDENNAFAVGLFKSMKPQMLCEIEEDEELKDQWPDSISEINGICMRTNKKLSLLDRDYAYKRFFSLDVISKQLKFMKKIKGKVVAQHDLSDIRWIDKNLSIDLMSGYRHIFEKHGNQKFAFWDKFDKVGDFKYPVAAGFKEDEIELIWFNKPETQLKFAAVLHQAERQALQERLVHQYLTSKSSNELVTSLYLSLRPKVPLDEDLKERVVQGYLKRAIHDKKGIQFKEFYAVLDTRTAMLRLFDKPNTQSVQQIDLQFARMMFDLDQKVKNATVNKGSIVTWGSNELPFGIHDCDEIHIFLAESRSKYDQWTAALESVANPEFQDGDLWVDLKGSNKNHKTNFAALLHELSPINDRTIDVPEISDTNSLNGYLLKTSQTKTGKIFYKRFYSVDFRLKELFVSGKEGGKVKDRFNLSKLISVDDTLLKHISPHRKQVFKRECKSKIFMPQDSRFPFALNFEDGQTQLLWAPTEQDFTRWTSMLQQFTTVGGKKYQLMGRTANNQFVSTFYMCMKPQLPAILLSTLIEDTAIKEILNEQPDQKKPAKKKKDEAKQAQQLDDAPVQVLNDEDYADIDALVSMKGVIEGWLFKTSQKQGMMGSLFHKRFYKLNLMTGELAVYEKFDAKKPKHTVELKGVIMKVDCEMRSDLNHINAEVELGKKVTLPPFKLPFAVFTDEDQMVLWADTEFDRQKWTQAFASLMEETNKREIEKFELVKTKQNKFVISLYQCLKDMKGIEGKAIQSVQPRRPKSIPVVKRVNLIQLQKDPGAADANQAETGAGVRSEDTEEAAQDNDNNAGDNTPKRGIGAKLNVLPSNQQEVQGSPSKKASASPLKGPMIKQISVSKKADQITDVPKNIKIVKKVNLTRKNSDSAQGSQKNLQVDSQRSSQQRPTTQGSQLNISSNGDGSQFNIQIKGAGSRINIQHTGPGSMLNIQEGSSGLNEDDSKPKISKIKISKKRTDASGLTSSRNDSMNTTSGNINVKQIVTNIQQHPPQRSGRYRAANVAEITSEQTSARDMNLTSGRLVNTNTGVQFKPGASGVIQIKKLIPTKEMSQGAPQYDLKSPLPQFYNKGQGLEKQMGGTSVRVFSSMQNSIEHDREHTDPDSGMQNENDDNIERDPGAEIIRPHFRRRAHRGLSAQGRIKVQMKPRQSVQDQPAASSDGFNAQAQQNMSMPAQNRIDFFKHSGIGLERGPDFEERVKNQRNDDFIDQLIQKTDGVQGSHRRSNTGLQSSQLWSNIADNLREQIKQKAAQDNNYQTQAPSDYVQQVQAPVERQVVAEPPAMKELLGATGPIKALDYPSGRQQLLGSSRPIDTGDTPKKDRYGNHRVDPAPSSSQQQHNNVAQVRRGPVQRSNTTDNHSILNLSPDKKTATATTVRETRSKQVKNDGELSDWDDSDPDEPSAVGLQSNNKRSRASSLLVNVRDHTSGLSNVFNSTNLQMQASQGSWFGNNTDYHGAARERYLASRKQMILANQASEEELKDQIEEDIVDESAAAAGQAFGGTGPANNQFEVPPNENDCLAESMNSVWD